MAYRATMQDEIRKGPWVEEEDEQLSTFVSVMGERRWDSIAKASGLRRSGKSCRLRWLNYLRPDLKHGQMTIEEECLIVELQERWGNKWSKIARRLPGRTDNEVKNYWRTHLRKKAQAQEQEKLQREIDNVMATKRFLLQEIDLRSSKFSGNENILNETENSGDGSAWSDSAFAYSPYEAQLCDWVSETLQDQDVLKYHGELDVDIWDYSADFLWDYGLKQH